MDSPAKKILKHTVSPTDTAQGVALKYNMSLTAFRKLNKLSTGDILHVGQEVNVYAKKENSKEKLENSKEISPHKTDMSKSPSKVPFLVTLRKSHDKRYLIESPDASPLSPASASEGYTPKDILDIRYIYRENVRRVTTKSTVGGVLTVTKDRIIFEPAIDDPGIKETGLLSCQFLCFIKDVIDARIISLSQRDREMFGIADSQTNYVDSQFLFVAVKNARIEIGYTGTIFIVNEVHIPRLNEHLQHVFMNNNVYHVNAESLQTPERFGHYFVNIFRSTHVENPVSDYDPDDDLFVPNLVDHSSILLNEDDILGLHSLLPPVYKQKSDWHLLYSNAKHGISMQTFYIRLRERLPTILLIEDSHRGVFGAFVSEEWQRSSSYYGTGETFLFILEPKIRRKAFHWTQKNSYFMYTTDQEIAFGGGRGIFGLWLGSSFASGTTGTCDTFMNETLSDGENFTTNFVEVWGFEPYQPNL